MQGAKAGQFSALYRSVPINNLTWNGFLIFGGTFKQEIISMEDAIRTKMTGDDRLGFIS